MKTHVEFTQHEDRVHGSDGRRRVVQTAAALFASAGLRGTTVSMIASAAGIPEGTLYAHFETKERLFRETVRNNIDARLRLLEARAVSAVHESEAAAVERIAEATVKVCTSGAGNSILTSWALLEDHEYAANLYRDEIGSVEFLWNRALAERFGDSPSRRILSIHLVPHAVSASLAYGFWLAALRHDASGAAAIAQGFVAGIGQTAAALLSKGGPYKYDRAPHDRALPTDNIRKGE
ncbi:MAG TPA: TetR/AcrR family transcriptional regulator [Bryobacteraceae bacterium]|nr:TetR/AcrR family transcriptional regulator [Bryobacteraceae bacterium]